MAVLGDFSLLILIAAVAALLSGPPVAVTETELRACLGTARVALNREKVGEDKAGLAEAAWRDACRQARDANERRLSVARVIQETTSSPIAGYDPALGFARGAKAAKDPEIAELLRRAAVDSATRGSLSRVNPNGPARGLSPLAQQLYDGLVASDAIANDLGNRLWLGAAVKRRGWFIISRDGQQANYAASLIVQHADGDLAFKREILTLLEPLALEGEASKAFFTQAYDRWAAAAKAPQRFGLQGDCKGPGVWEPLPIEDPDHVDARRHAFGIEQPLGEQIQLRGQACT